MVFHDTKVNFRIWPKARCADESFSAFDAHFEFLLVDGGRRKEGGLSPCPEPIRQFARRFHNALKGPAFVGSSLV